MLGLHCPQYSQQQGLPRFLLDCPITSVYNVQQLFKILSCSPRTLHGQALQSNNPTFMQIGFCICYFSIAMIKCHNQNQFMEEFILVYGVSGIEFIMTRETRHGDRSRKLANHIFITHRKQR